MGFSPVYYIPTFSQNTTVYTGERVGFRGGGKLHQGKRWGTVDCPLSLSGQHFPVVSLCQCLSREGRFSLVPVASSSKGVWVGNLILERPPLEWPLPMFLFYRLCLRPPILLLQQGWYLFLQLSIPFLLYLSKLAPR